MKAKSKNGVGPKMTGRHAANGHGTNRTTRAAAGRGANPPALTRLYRTRNDLPEKMRVKVIELLNQRLANCIDLQTQCKQAHWNVKGSSFIGLHKLFDEINEAVEDYVDKIAERAIELGGIVAGTARMVAARSQLTDYPLVLTTSAEHVAALSDALSTFGRTARAGIDEAEDLGDKDTADLLTGISREIDKWLWFVEAHGQGALSAAE